MVECSFSVRIRKDSHVLHCFLHILHFQTTLTWSGSRMFLFGQNKKWQSLYPTLSDNPDLKACLSRVKVWQAVGQVCAGTWFRFICNFGLGDLPRLTHAPHLFVNKFRYEMHPVAFECMERWHATRTKRGVGADFNLSFYSNQPWVKYHHWY